MTWLSKLLYPFRVLPMLVPPNPQGPTKVCLPWSTTPGCANKPYIAPNRLANYHKITEVPLWVDIGASLSTPEAINTLLWTPPHLRRNFTDPILRHSLAVWDSNQVFREVPFQPLCCFLGFFLSHLASRPPSWWIFWSPQALDGPRNGDLNVLSKL